MQEGALYEIVFDDPETVGAWVINDLDVWLGDDDDEARDVAKYSEALEAGEHVVFLNEEQTCEILPRDFATDNVKSSTFVFVLTRVGVGWVSKRLCRPAL